MFTAHSRHGRDCSKQYKVSILISLHSSGETTSKQIHIMINIMDKYKAESRG